MVSLVTPCAVLPPLSARHTSATYCVPAVHRPDVPLGVNLMMSDILITTQL